MNIGLIGMTGCGKNTIGELLAKKLGCDFYDSDALVESEQGRTISSIFETDGELFFRELERGAIEKLSRYENAVIATGGGAVLDPRNTGCLKNGGVVVFINRPLEHIYADIVTENRPLLKNGKDALYQMYERRLPMYKGQADIEIINDKPLDEVVNAIIAAVKSLNR